MYIKRHVESELADWKLDDKRKPLLIRGARQVGKTQTVREFSKKFDNFIEINFDEKRQLHSVFESDLSPIEICENLSAIYGITIIPGKTLLFFDEIQECLPAIKSLRYFYEKIPDLHLIAAGSLLEFALSEIPSFGVGRIRSLFMYPLSFYEFLDGCGEEILLSKLKKATANKPLHEVLHNQLLHWLYRFMILGGMPEVVSTYIETRDFNSCQQILDDLIISFNDDFAKYKNRVPVSRLRGVFESVVSQAGGKFKYSKAISDTNHKQIKETVELLIMAGLVIPVTHSSANGLPLGAEANHGKRKMVLFDTGIFQRILDLDISKMLLEKDFSVTNKGNIAEQYTALELIKAASCYKKENLYYWHREATNSNAEVDYIIAKNNQIIPVEVKSGTKGAMQSMYLFLDEKNREKGIRISLENFAAYGKIDVVPLYAVANLL